VDRRAAERLRRAGLIDAACHLGVPWEASSGHWPGDPHGPRRVDRFLASADLAAGLATHRVWRTPAALGLSDHLPVVIGLDEVALR
jgi:exonuclease III